MIIRMMETRAKTREKMQLQVGFDTSSPCLHLHLHLAFSLIR